MEIELVPSPGDPVEMVAVARAVAAAGLVLGVGSAGPGAGSGARPWWRAGIAEAVGRASLEPERRRRYDGEPLPRSTRGATRA